MGEAIKIAMMVNFTQANNLEQITPGMIKAFLGHQSLSGWQNQHPHSVLSALHNAMQDRPSAVLPAYPWVFTDFLAEE